MKRSLMLLALLATAPAIADDLQFYTVEVWAQPGGTGVARTLGPLTREECSTVVRNQHVAPGTIPPSMQLFVHDCRSLDQVQAVLQAFRCQAGPSRAEPKHPGVTLWVYSCVMLP
jgi:hypothetical protein